jgi:outer membrane protein OmpA-like peptidoglycan-associated protein
MKTNRYPLLLLLLIVCHFVQGQGPRYNKADKHFSQFEYVAAVEEYLEILSLDSTSFKAMERLAICYDKLNDPANAEKWLRKLCVSGKAEAPHIKLYVQVLAENGKYTESSMWYKRYLAKSADEHATNTLNSYSSLNAFFNDSTFYSIRPLALNSNLSDFSPVMYKDGILFCSSRPNGQKSTYAWDNSAFIDLYFSKLDASNVENFGKPVNTPLHEGPACFSRNYDTIYFTRNNSQGNRKMSSSEGIVKLKIYSSAFVNGVWQKEESLSLNSHEYSMGHPAMAPDGRLYFASDMPGGFGGTDLYYTKRQPDGTWGSPVNLGPVVNTSGNELFPFVDQNGELYFASNTHPGLGGLDIFYSGNIDKLLDAPVNLGYPINSSKDDFGMVITGDNGYFSSNRGADPKDDNIYQITIKKRKNIRIAPVFPENTLLEDYAVTILHESDSATTRIKEIFTYQFHADSVYHLILTKQGYRRKSILLSKDDFRKLPENDLIKVPLEPSVKPVAFVLQSADGQKLKDGLLEIRNLTTGDVTRYMVSSDADPVMNLSETSQYEITASSKNYKTKIQVLAQADIAMLQPNASYVVALPLLNALFEKTAIGETIELEIKYDVNKATIRKDAAVELDKLVAFMKRNVSAKVELGSHTDSRGSNDANLKLSQKRAESAVRYLVGKGINANRLIPIGYGEDVLKVQNAKTEEEHQHNRRTTVKIVGI